MPSWPRSSGGTPHAICFSDHTGVIYCHSSILASQISDGLSNTYLAGEKYLTPDNYETGMDDGDNHVWAWGPTTTTCADGPIMTP